MEDISLHILDIAENSVSAGATWIRIALLENTEEGRLTIEIEDNGKGIPEEIRRKVFDPFYTSRTTRKVGLGLPLLAQSARQTGGDISVRTAVPSGTIVSANFRTGHIDMKPLGDIAGTLVVLIAGNPLIDFLFICTKDSRSFSLDTRRIKEELEGLPLTAPPVLTFLRDYLGDSLRELNGPVV